MHLNNPRLCALQKSVGEDSRGQAEPYLLARRSDGGNRYERICEKGDPGSFAVTAVL